MRVFLATLLGSALLVAVAVYFLTLSGAYAAECGGASWYRHGTTTASGAPFIRSHLTAAHRTLPFGTRVHVVDRRSGRSVDVVINDRGPFVRGRIIDLSPAAAAAIGLTGVDPVCISP